MAEIRKRLYSAQDANEAIASCGGYRFTYLNVAVNSGSVEVVVAVLDSGANPRLAPEGTEPVLHAFVKNRNFKTLDLKLEAIRILVHRGADIDAPLRASPDVPDGMFNPATPLARFIEAGEIKEAAVLVEMGANLRPPLIAKEGRQYADRRQRANWPVYPVNLLYPVLNQVDRNPDAWELAILMVSKGANVNAGSGTAPEPPIVRFPLGGTPTAPPTENTKVALLKFYLDSGGDPRRAAGGWTLLHQYSDCVACVRLLILAGSQVNAKDGLGRTPLDIARARNSTDSIEVLRAAGADR